MLYGYARVSTKDQNADRQIAALMEHGVKRDNIYIDKQSGKDLYRTYYKKLLRKLKPGDVFVVESMDRLGRNYRDNLDQYNRITKVKGCGVIIIDMPYIQIEEKDLTQEFIADVSLAVKSFTAEAERDAIRKRQAEGIAAAKKRGVKFGRPKKDKPDNYITVKQAWLDGIMSMRKAAAELGVSRETFKKWVFE